MPVWSTAPPANRMRRSRVHHSTTPAVGRRLLRKICTQMATRKEAAKGTRNCRAPSVDPMSCLPYLSTSTICGSSELTRAQLIGPFASERLRRFIGRSWLRSITLPRCPAATGRLAKELTKARAVFRHGIILDADPRLRGSNIAGRMTHRVPTPMKKPPLMSTATAVYAIRDHQKVRTTVRSNG
jgi:hypothetical protein